MMISPTLSENANSTNVWDYERLIKRMKQWLFEQQPLPPLFFSALSKMSQKQIVLDMHQKEYDWLQYYGMDFLPKYISNNLSATILYFFNKNPYKATVRDIATRLGLFDRPVRYWIDKFWRCELLKTNQNIADARHSPYIKNPDLANVHKVIMGLILYKYGEETLAKNLKKGSCKGSKSCRYNRIWYKNTRSKSYYSRRRV